MKPKNFPGRKFRRQARAQFRATGSHPDGYTDQPSDATIRVGKKMRDARGQVRT